MGEPGAPEEGDHARRRGSLAEKLSELLETRTNPKNGRPYSVPAIARQIRAMLIEQGYEGEELKRRELSRGYLWELKDGRKDNPTRVHLLTLSAFFKVPIGYLAKDEDSGAEDDELMELPNLSLRARGLSPTTVATIAEWIRHARTLEGLEDAYADDGHDRNGPEKRATK
jgi:transcriptional regulator with XRE-family HTH domain